MGTAEGGRVVGGFWTVLPMAVVMIAGPQIVTAVFLATSDNWLRNSLAFLLGVAGAVSLGVGIAYAGSSMASGSARRIRSSTEG